jgi:hypothetical protein
VSNRNNYSLHFETFNDKSQYKDLLSLNRSLLKDAYATEIEGKTWGKPLAALMQCVTIAFLIFFWRKYPIKKFPPSKKEETDNKVKLALKVIRLCWLALFISWFLLYFFLFFYYAEESFLSISRIIPVSPDRITLLANLLTTTFNYLNTMAIVICFTYLNEQGEREEESLWYKSKYLWLPFIFWLATLFAYVMFYQDEKVSSLLDLFTGVVAGISIALFVGRLQSKFLGTRPWLLMFLYSYTALQPLYFYLTNNEGWNLGVVLLINLYLILKCLLYLYMAWIFESTRLSFYLVKIRESHKDIEKNWNKWLKSIERKQIS